MPPPSTTHQRRARRVGVILPLLKRMYPSAKCSLNFTTPLELIVATILSAQCTDERVNIVTRSLFARYRTAADFAQADVGELERLIQSTGFFRNKARSIVSMAQSLLEHHAGQVPQTMDELTRLAGVGRKTANVVLGNAFGINAGVTVDTHVSRLSKRLGLTRHTDAVKIESDLMPIVPREDWCMASHLLIHHGRVVCQARKPGCQSCQLLPQCPAGSKLVKASELTPKPQRPHRPKNRRGEARMKQRVNADRGDTTGVIGSGAGTSDAPGDRDLIVRRGTRSRRLRGTANDRDQHR